MSALGALDTAGLAVVGEGSATAADLTVVRPKRRSSLYADPLAWLVADAVGWAVESCGERLLAARESVGQVVVSDGCTTHTMRGITASVAAGRLSPLRFSGANPGSVLGLTAQLLGISGPSMTLSMTPDKGLPTALALARVWLGGRAATHVLVTSHRADGSGHRVTCTVLAPLEAG